MKIIKKELDEMDKFSCDGSYERDLAEYTESVVERYGVSSNTAEREILYLADKGNTVALKLYADMVFYKKMLKKNPYREAFSLYLRSAGISTEADKWDFDSHSYPLSFWMVGYYLVNYRRESVLKYCEEIEGIERMSLPQRFGTALGLAVAALKYVKAPGAMNLIGRILQAAGQDGELYEALEKDIKSNISKELLEGLGLDETSIEEGISRETGLDLESGYPNTLAFMSELFFSKAANEGYVYACNNLARREADHILELSKDKDGDIEIQKHVLRYRDYLKLSADKYEPYAANSLGLFYEVGEIRGSDGNYICRDYVDHALAREYFKKATIYPDKNSAWGYLNLIKYCHKIYEGNLDLLNEHMDYIKELNPEVYDIAIEL